MRPISPFQSSWKTFGGIRNLSSDKTISAACGPFSGKKLGGRTKFDRINIGHFLRRIIIVLLIKSSELELNIFAKSIEIRAEWFGNSLKKVFGIYGTGLTLI
jgi:hypothetical protein